VIAFSKKATEAIRERRALWTSLCSALGRLIGLVGQLTTVPLTVAYLGPERYGLWMVLLAAVALISLTDLGISNGIITKISRSVASDVDTQKAFISNAFYCLLVLAILVAVIALILVRNISWQTLFSIGQVNVDGEFRTALDILILTSASALPASICSAVLRARQEGYIAAVWQALGSLLSIGCVFLVVYFHGGLPLLVLATSGIPILTSIVLHCLTFYGRLKALRPSIALTNATGLRAVAQNSLVYFVLQVSGVLGVTFQSLIVASNCGLIAVANYSIAMRIAGILHAIIAIILNPLWPAFGDALATGDIAWARRTFLKSIYVTLALGVPIAAAILFYGEPIVTLWLGPNSGIKEQLLAATAVWTLIYAVGQPFAVLVNGAGVLRPQLYICTVFLVTVIPASFISSGMWGEAGAVWALSTTFLLVDILPYCFIVNKILRISNAPKSK
jgi:O-antigen/teichoic acid export membrane protein